MSFSVRNDHQTPLRSHRIPDSHILAVSEPRTIQALRIATSQHIETMDQQSGGLSNTLKEKVNSPRSETTVNESDEFKKAKNVLNEQFQQIHRARILNVYGKTTGSTKKKLFEILHRNKQMNEVYQNRRQILNQDVQSLQEQYFTYCNKIEQIEYLEKKFGGHYNNDQKKIVLPSINISPRQSPVHRERKKQDSITQNILKKTLSSEISKTPTLIAIDPLQESTLNPSKPFYEPKQKSIVQKLNTRRLKILTDNAPREQSEVRSSRTSDTQILKIQQVKYKGLQEPLRNSTRNSMQHLEQYIQQQDLKLETRNDFITQQQSISSQKSRHQKLLFAEEESRDSLPKVKKTEKFNKLMMNYENSINEQLTKLDYNIKMVNKMEIQSGNGILERRRKKTDPKKTVKFQIDE